MIKYGAPSPRSSPRGERRSRASNRTVSFPRTIGTNAEHRTPNLEHRIKVCGLGKLQVVLVADCNRLSLNAATRSHSFMLNSAFGVRRSAFEVRPFPLGRKLSLSSVIFC